MINAVCPHCGQVRDDWRNHILRYLKDGEVEVVCSKCLRAFAIKKEEEGQK